MISGVEIVDNIEQWIHEIPCYEDDELQKQIFDYILGIYGHANLLDIVHIEPIWTIEFEFDRLNIWVCMDIVYEGLWKIEEIEIITDFEIFSFDLSM